MAEADDTFLHPYAHGAGNKRVAWIADLANQDSVSREKSKAERLYTNLGYQVDFCKCPLRKLKKKTFFDELKSVTGNLNGKFDSFAFILLCHVQNGSFRMPNGETFEPKEIYNEFNAKNCPALKCRPKFFIFLSYPYVTMNENQHCSKGTVAPVMYDKKGGIKTVPVEADMYVIHSFQDHVEPTEPSQGPISPDSQRITFMDVLSKVLVEDFEKENDHEDIKELIVSVTAKIEKYNETSGQCINAPIPWSTLNSEYFLK